MTLQLITVHEYCSIHSLDPVFITSLQEDGIIEFTVIDNEAYLHLEQLQDLETYTRWYYELGINTEGIDAIRHLLRKIRTLQDEIKLLKNRLSFFESINIP
jgi:hypothetical protein